MATTMTINTSPLAINPAYREIKWKVTSSDANIKAIRADLWINGSYTTTVDGVQILGTSDQFNFDVRKIMQSHLVSELRTNITTFQVTDATTSAATIKMRFFEIIETDGVFTTDWAKDGQGAGYEESADFDVVNMVTQHQETLADWTVDDATKQLLTLRTNNTRIPRGVPFQVGFVSGDSDLKANLIERDINLTQISDTTTSVLGSLSYSKGVIEIPASAFSNTNTAFIDVKLENATADRSILYRYKVVDNYDKFTLFIQNHLGGFDHFDFGTKVIESISTKNQSFKKPLPSGFSSEDAGTVVISSKVKTKIKVQTGALSDAELTLMSEFIRNHSVVYKWDSAGVFLRYTITSHSRKVVDTEKHINSISLTLAPSNEHLVQKGD